MFVKNAPVAIALQIHFQTLELQTQFIRNIGERQRGKIGLTGARTDGGELGRDNLDFIVPLGMTIGKREGMTVGGKLLRMTNANLAF